MAGRGPAPSPSRKRSPTPGRGEWEAAHGIGWQHGRTPKPPADLTTEARRAWSVWMHAWFAAHWLPEDLPGLHQTIRLYDLTVRFHEEPTEWPPEGVDAKPVRRPNPATELRQMMDTYGITPKGQQDRRWKRPEPEQLPSAEHEPSPYGHLKVAK